MTREDILEAAAQVFRQKGFHGASMNDIAEAVNLQKASLYHHVSSKQEILLEFLDQALQLLLERISAISTQNISADEKLRLMICEYLQILADNVDLSAVLLFEHRALDRKQHARHVPSRDKFEALWRDVLAEGVKSKLFLCDDIDLTARALLGSDELDDHLVSPQRRKDDSTDRRRLFQSVIKRIAQMSEKATFASFAISHGTKIYRLPLQAFPNFWVYAYLVQQDGDNYLIDCGSGMELSHEDLLHGLNDAGLSPADLSYILLTHAHIDHYGGLSVLKPLTTAKIGCQELDVQTVAYSHGAHGADESPPRFFPGRYWSR